MISISDLEAFLQQVLGEDYPVEAQAACDMATSVVEEYCKRSFARVADDELTLRWRPSIVLPNPPVTAVTSFEVDGEPATYDLDESGRIWPTVRGDSINLTYTHGYAKVPEAVRLVAVRIAARIFKNPQGRVSYSADSLQFQGSPETSPRILTDNEMGILRRYRLHTAQ